MYSLKYSYIHDFVPGSNYPPGGVDCKDTYRSHVEILIDDCSDYNRLQELIDAWVCKTFGVSARREEKAIV